MVREVGDRIKVPTDSVGAVVKAAWKHKQGAVRMAVTAAETARTDSFRLFCTLALRKQARPSMAI